MTAAAEPVTRFCVSCGAGITVPADSDAAWGPARCWHCKRAAAPSCDFCDVATTGLCKGLCA